MCIIENHSPIIFMMVAVLIVVMQVGLIVEEEYNEEKDIYISCYSLLNNNVK